MVISYCGCLYLTPAKAALVDRQNLSFPKKMVFFDKPPSPISWGTESIMLPPVVDFKKILQQSYKRVIPK
jgi:hypothetical protein